MIKAIDDKIIVSELKRGQTASGILIPLTAIEPQAYGKIISMGEKVTNKSLNVGDVIVYHKMGGQAISMNNKILCCVPYSSVYGLLTDEVTLAELEEIKTSPIQPTPEASALAGGESPLIQRV